MKYFFCSFDVSIELRKPILTLLKSDPLGIVRTSFNDVEVSLANGSNKWNRARCEIEVVIGVPIELICPKAPTKFFKIPHNRTRTGLKRRMQNNVDYHDCPEKTKKLIVF